MKKKKLWKLVAVSFLVVNLTGCTTVLKNNGKAVKNDETGQTLTGNIICKPTAPSTIKKYEQTRQETEERLKKQLEEQSITKSKYNKEMKKIVDINTLESCDTFTPMSGGYEGIWTTLFVKPLAWLIVKVGSFVHSYGLSLILITLLIRAIMYPITKKTAMQSENLKLAQSDLDRLEKKYKGREDQESMMAKSQEMMMIYKKHHINPLSGCLFSFLQIPLFFAFYEAIMRLPAIFEENFLGLQLGTNPTTAFAHGHYYYVILIIMIAAATFFSFKLNSGASMSKEQAKQMKMMMNIMAVMITIMSFGMASGVAVYWITGSIFTITQNLIVKRSKKKYA